MTVVTVVSAVVLVRIVHQVFEPAVGGRFGHL